MFVVVFVVHLVVAFGCCLNCYGRGILGKVVFDEVVGVNCLFS